MKKETGNINFTLVFSNGREKSFHTGYQMWAWANSNRRGWEYDYDEKTTPSLSDYFERRRNKKSK